jgi:hypothetical protein
MIMMPYGRCRSSLQLTGTQTSGTPQVAEHQRLPVRSLGDRSLNDVKDAGEFGSQGNLLTRDHRT